MKNQVLSIEQMQNLHKLGVDTSEASMCWCVNSRGFYELQSIASVNNYDVRTDSIPTFTLQEALDYLKKIDIGYLPGFGTINENGTKIFLKADIFKEHVIENYSDSDISDLLIVAYDAIEWVQKRVNNRQKP